jgi:hypothetical protein
MPRISLPVSAVFSILLLAACDDAATEQQKAIGAQTEANTKMIAASNVAGQKVANAQAEATSKIVAATNEADQKAKDAQLEADRKVAAAKANIMKLREDYRHTIQINLIELDRKLVDLETQAKKATGKARAELTAKIKQIHARREAFTSNNKALDSETGATWDDAKARLDKEWSELKALVEKS